MKDIWIDATNKEKKVNKKKIFILTIIIVFIVIAIITIGLYSTNDKAREWIDKNIFRKEVLQDKVATIDLKENQDSNIYAFNKYIKRLNEVYDNYEALYKNEYDSSYFKWLEVNAPEKSVYIYERGRSDHRIIVALNFSDNEYAPFTFKVEEVLRLREIVNSDSDIYGGSTWGMRSDVTTTKEDNYLYNLSINLKPFSGIIYEVVND